MLDAEVALWCPFLGTDLSPFRAEQVLFLFLSRLFFSGQEQASLVTREENSSAAERRLWAATLTSGIHLSEEAAAGSNNGPGRLPLRRVPRSAPIACCTFRSLGSFEGESATPCLPLMSELTCLLPISHASAAAGCVAWKIGMSCCVEWNIAVFHLARI